jgi:hypothetical protein
MVPPRSNRQRHERSAMQATVPELAAVQAGASPAAGADQHIDSSKSNAKRRTIMVPA